MDRPSHLPDYCIDCGVEHGEASYRCIECQRARPVPLDVVTRDWVATRITEHVGRYYRFHVEGINLNWPEGHPDRNFSWSVPDLDMNRYDVSGAVYTVRS